MDDKKCVDIETVAKYHSRGMEGAIEYAKQVEKENECRHTYIASPSSYSPTGILVCSKCGKLG